MPHDLLPETEAPPSYTVEGRLGRRWWTWQRFAEHDDAARAIANLIEAKRFDAIRLLETQHRAGRPPVVLRELFLYDPASIAVAYEPATAVVAPTPPVPPSVPAAAAAAPSRPVAVPTPGAARPAAIKQATIKPRAPVTRATTPIDAAPLMGAPAAQAVSEAFARMAAEVSAQQRRVEAKAQEQRRAVAATATAPTTTPAAPPAAPWPALWRATVPMAASATPGRMTAAPAPAPARDPFDDTGADDYAPLVAAEERAIPAVDAQPVAARADATPAPKPQQTWDPAEIDAAMAALKAALREVEAVVPSRTAAAPPPPQPLPAFTASDRPSVAPANDAAATDGAANDRVPPAATTAGEAGDPYWDEAPPVRVARAGAWRFRLRRVGYSLGAAAASILLAIAGYETTRLAIGLPDLLGGAGNAIGALLAGPERPIVAAARRGDGAEVERLLKGGFSAESADPQGVPVLLVAARGGHGDIVRLLLDAGADPNRRFGEAETPILVATREGLLPAVDAMLTRGGQVNGRGGQDDCDTPLLLAAGAGRLEMVTFLLSRGATFDVLPGCRRGPLDAAAPHPRVRDALETAYQRRLAGVQRTAPAIAPAVATGSDVAVPRALAMTPPLAPPTPPPTPAPPPVPTLKPAIAEPKAEPTGYGALMYGFGWHESLAEVKAKAKDCRASGRRYEVCTLAVKPIFDDAGVVEAWFDRADNDRFVSIETRSIDLIDYTAQRDGAVVRRRFDEVRRELERFMPPGARPIVQRNPPPGSMTFFEGLKPDAAAGDFSAFWSDESRRRPASVHLKITGIDNRKGFYRIVVSNPLRQTQQAQAPAR